MPDRVGGRNPRSGLMVIEKSDIPQYRKKPQNDFLGGKQIG